MSSSLSCFQFSMSNLPFNTPTSRNQWDIQISVPYQDITAISTYQSPVRYPLFHPSPLFFSCLPAAKLRSSIVCALRSCTHKEFPHPCPLHQTFVSSAFSRPLCRRRLLWGGWFRYYTCAPLNRHNLRLYDGDVGRHFHSCLRQRQRSP